MRLRLMSEIELELLSKACQSMHCEIKYRMLRGVVMHHTKSALNNLDTVI